MEKYNLELKRENMKKFIIRLVLISLILILIFFFFIYPLIKIKYSIYKVDDNSLDQSFNNFKIMQVSDLYLTENSKMDSIEKMVNEKKPNMLVFTGNIFTSEDPDYYQNFMRFKSKINENIMVYITKGESELGLDSKYCDELYGHLQDKGVYLLDNRRVSLNRGGSTINVYGLTSHIDDYSNEEGDTLATPKINFEEDRFNLVLCHNPTYSKVLVEQGANLILSGSRNGGWVRLPFIGGLNYSKGTKFKEGLYPIKSSTLIVSRGSGNKSGKLRIFNPREINEIDLGS